MLEVSLKIHGIDTVGKSIQELGKQLPIVIAKALTFTAERVRDRLVDEMKTVFDRPTPYTLKSMYLKTATPGSLTAEVFLKDKWFTKGPDATDWLGPEIFGGGRNMKRSERAFWFTGVLPQGKYIMPGANAEIDPYGNMSRGQINRMLSYFQSAEMLAGVTRNTSAKKKAAMARGTRNSLGITYFVIKSKRGNLHPGIYSKVAGKIKPVMIFAKKPSYRPIFHFYKVGEATAEKVWPAMIQERIEKELQRLALK